MSELESYNKDLTKKPHLIVANKIDLPDAETNLEKLKEQIKLPIIAISAMKHISLDILIKDIAKAVEKEQLHQVNNDENNEEHILYEYINKEEVPQVFITKIASNQWTISGKTVEVIYQKNPLNNYHNILLFKIKLQDLGIYDELRKQGIKKVIMLRFLIMIWFEKKNKKGQRKIGNGNSN